MTRDELEAVIWRNMPVTPRAEASRRRVEDILVAADEYARHTGGITAERRAVLDAVPQASHKPYRRQAC